MRIIQTIILGVAGAVISAGIACATTVRYTEGARPLVNGSIAVADNLDDSIPGFNLGVLATSGAGTVDTIDLFGRIETSHDIFYFQANSAFEVDFIFGGYKLANGTLVSASGFVADPSVSPNPGNTSDFKLRITSPGDLLLSTVTYTTPYLSGDSFIFSATAPGIYRFRIDGGVNGPGGAAFYDIRILTTPTPLPAALPVFATGLGLGMGMLGWRRKRTRAASAI
jgi:hypothetical protein